MTLYSDVTSGTASRAHFTRHQVHEVATTLTESKQVARDASEHERYAYRAKAVLLGDVDVSPYDAIYLDNLPGGMSGYWTVLAVNHIFGGGVTYQLEVELGTDILGVTDSQAGYPAHRDVEAELAGAGDATTPVYVDALFLPGLSNENSKYGGTRATTATTSVTPSAPDFSIIRRPEAWRASR